MSRQRFGKIATVASECEALSKYFSVNRNQYLIRYAVVKSRIQLKLNQNPDMLNSYS